MQEAWWMILISAILFSFSIFVYMRPELFLGGHRSAFWIKLIGVDRTTMIIRYFSAPLLAVIAIAIFILSVHSLLNPSSNIVDQFSAPLPSVTK